MNVRIKKLKGVVGTCYVTDDARVMCKDELLGKFYELEQVHRGTYVGVQLLDARSERIITKSVAKLVALAFVPNPEMKKYIVHKDGDMTNNRADNLEWSWLSPFQRRQKEETVELETV